MGFKGDRVQALEKPYVRLNVYDYVDEFCGFEPIEELIKYGGSHRNEMYITSLFKTGGRAGEVLGLATDNFEVDKRRKVLLCSSMKLEKRYKKIKNEDGFATTQKIDAVRKPFPIPLEETLTKEQIEYLAATPDGPLFASPYKTHTTLTVSWGYKFIRNLSSEIPKTLFRNLGLDRPLINKLTGKEVTDTIHLWQHWFRAQRASQLKSDYDFSEAELMEFFGWLDIKTAMHYSHLGYSKLAEKMRQHK